MDPIWHGYDHAAQPPLLYNDGKTLYNMSALPPSLAPAVSMPPYSAFNLPNQNARPAYCFTPSVPQVYQPIGYHGYGLPISAPYQSSVYQPVPYAPHAIRPTQPVFPPRILSGITTAESRISVVPPLPQSQKIVEKTVASKDTLKDTEKFVIALSNEVSSDDDSVLEDKVNVTASNGHEKASSTKISPIKKSSPENIVLKPSHSPEIDNSPVKTDPASPEYSPVKKELHIKSGCSQTLASKLSKRKSPKKPEIILDESLDVQEALVQMKDLEIGLKSAMTDNGLKDDVRQECCNNTLASKLAKNRQIKTDINAINMINGERTASSSPEVNNVRRPSRQSPDVKVKLPDSPEVLEIKNLPAPDPVRASFELQRRMYMQLMDLYDDFEAECDTAGVDPEKVDLASYAEEAWPYIAKAAINPFLLSENELAEVGRVIVTRALEDTGYVKTAVNLINCIFQKESAPEKAEISGGHFRQGLLNACENAVDSWDDFVQMGLLSCFAVMDFFADMYLTLTVSGSHLSSFGNSLLDLLFVISKPPMINNFELVQQMCCVLHDCGKDLDTSNPQQFNAIFCNLRDAIIGLHVDPEIRRMLLGPIELRASGWKFTDAAQKYYFT